MVSHEIVPDYYLKLSGDFEMLFSVGLFDFDWTYAISTPVKTYKTRDSFFPQHSTTTPYSTFDAESHRESYDV